MVDSKVGDYFNTELECYLQCINIVKRLHAQNSPEFNCDIDRRFLVRSRLHAFSSGKDGSLMLYFVENCRLGLRCLDAPVTLPLGFTEVVNVFSAMPTYFRGISSMLRHGSIFGLDPCKDKAVFILRPCILILKVAKNF